MTYATPRRRRVVGGGRPGSRAQVFAPVTLGSYQNYIDPTLADWDRPTTGPTWRGCSGEKEDDPDDVFHFAQSIPLPQ